MTQFSYEQRAERQIEGGCAKTSQRKFHYGRRGDEATSLALPTEHKKKTVFGFSGRKIPRERRSVCVISAIEIGGAPKREGALALTTTSHCNFPSDWITMSRSIFILASLSETKRLKVTEIWRRNGVIKRRHDTPKKTKCTITFNRPNHSSYLSPINCSVELDCMLLVRSSSHHSGNDDWKFGKPSVSNRRRKVKINENVNQVTAEIFPINVTPCRFWACETMMTSICLEAIKSACSGLVCRTFISVQRWRWRWTLKFPNTKKLQWMKLTSWMPK